MYFQACFLFCLAFLTFCYLLSLHHWNCSRDFCFLKWCCLYLYLHWSLSLTFVISLPTLSFPSTLSLLGFHNSILTSPFWQLRLPFPFLFTMEISADFLSFASPHGSVPSHVGSVLRQWRVHLSWSLHPSIQSYILAIMSSWGGVFANSTFPWLLLNFWGAPRVLLQSLYLAYKHCPSFCSTLLLGLIKASPTPRHPDHVQALQPFLSKSQHSCTFPPFSSPLYPYGRDP